MRFRTFAALLIIILAVAAAATLSAGTEASSSKAGSVPQPSTASTKTERAPNELGQVMILEYHLIGTPESDWRRTPENFRADLEMLYQKGYYPVLLGDFLKNRMDVPAGKSPVVITFDDSSAGQFRFIEKEGRIIVDPDSAIGMMERFTQKHPDFPSRATFFVLPAIDPKLRLFGQPEHIAAKLRYLAEHGYEIGSHTYWHQNLAKATPEQVRFQLAKAEQAIQEYVPGYRLRSLALPFGASPSDPLLLREGEYEGHHYKLNAVLLVGSGPAMPFGHVKQDPYRLPRIQAGDHSLGPAAWIRYFDKNPGLRYVSDGSLKTLTIPESASANLRPGSFPRITIVAIPEASPANP